MTVSLLDQEVEVIVERKNNRNTYVRVKDDFKIYVTTHYLTTNNQIKKIINSNLIKIEKMFNKKVKHSVKSDNFYYLGQKYDIIMVSTIEKTEIYNDKIFVQNKDVLDKWYSHQIKIIFQERLKYNYDLFEENIPYPKLRIREMKTRWGVCNIKNNIITLNSLLIKESIDKIDYVIIHELSHLLQANHSSLFWEVVNKYCPNYKKIRKNLKE